MEKAGKRLVKEVAKHVPGGNVVNATVAAALTGALGEAYIRVCSEMLRRKAAGKPMPDGRDAHASRRCVREHPSKAPRLSGGGGEQAGADRGRLTSRHLSLRRRETEPPPSWVPRGRVAAAGADTGVRWASHWIRAPDKNRDQQCRTYSSAAGVSIAATMRFRERGREPPAPLAKRITDRIVDTHWKRFRLSCR